jgi:hypothetical protein
MGVMGMDTPLVRTRLGHFEVACCQDVVNAAFLALTPLGARHFSGFCQSRRFRETTTELTRCHGRGERASLRMLRETIFLEELGLGGEDLPLLAERIGIFDDCCTIASSHVSFIVAHEANAVSEAVFVALFNRNSDKVLEGLDLDALLPTQMHLKHMLVLDGLGMRELKTGEFTRQLGASHTIEEVDALATNFKHIFAHAEYGTGNVREVTADRRPDVDVQPLARLKRITVDQDEVTLPVVVIAMSVPSLEMRVSGTGGVGNSVRSDGKHRESKKVHEIELHIALKLENDVGVQVNSQSTG